MKRGFTLVELLAVLLILGVILTITYYSVNAIIESSRTSLSDTQKSAIEESAKVYYLEEGMNNNATCVTIEYLLSEGYIEKSKVVDPEDNQEMKGYVTITQTNNKYTYTFTKINASDSYPNGCVVPTA